MAENSKIEWTDHTFNPWIGCTKVSDGCKYCYAETLMDKRVRTSAANWREPLAWNRQAKAEGRRYRVFCASLADVFEYKPDQPEMDDWRRELFQMITNTPHLDWLLLTKRPELVNETIERVTGFSDSEMWFFTSHVWIGTSVENQEQADKRIPELLEIPAAVRFLSMEPLLGNVQVDLDGINWVIVGGESGANARPMHPDWARSIRNQCKEVGVPFFFKQWGEWLPECQVKEQDDWERLMDSGTHHMWDDIVTVRVGKKAAGRLLDGREWNEFPTTEVLK